MSNRVTGIGDILNSLGSMTLRLNEQNVEKIVSILEMYCGASRSEIDKDLRRISYGTLTDPCKLEIEILDLTPSNSLVSVIDYIQRAAQRIGLAASDGQLQSLWTMRLNSQPRAFSFEYTKQYMEIKKACARRNSRARVKVIFDRLKNLICCRHQEVLCTCCVRDSVRYYCIVGFPLLVTYIEFRALFVLVQHRC